MTFRDTIDCPACGQAVGAIGGKPMIHYLRGTNQMCSGEAVPCRACGEMPVTPQDVTLVANTGICSGCSDHGG